MRMDRGEWSNRSLQSRSKTARASLAFPAEPQLLTRDKGRTCDTCADGDFHHVMSRSEELEAHVFVNPIVFCLVF